MEGIIDGHYHIRWFLCIEASTEKKLVYQHYVRHRSQPSQLVVVCGDLPEGESHTSLWKEIHSEYSDMIVHLGDNVNLDSEVAHLLSWAESNTSQSHLGEVAMKLFSLRYRYSWQRWIRELDDVPHIFCMGEHDLGNLRLMKVNDFSINHEVLNRAYEAYDSYQGLLTGNVMKYHDGRPWYKQWMAGKKKVVFISVDMDSSMNEEVKESENTFFSPILQGSRMKGELRYSMLDLVDDEVELLLIGLPLPIISLPTSILPLNMVYRSLPSQCIQRLLGWAEGWLSFNKNRRVVLLCGGALFGAVGTVKRKVNSLVPEIHFALIPPIVNQVDLQSLVDRYLIELGGKEEGEYIYNFEKITSKRSYLNLDISLSEPVLKLGISDETLPSPRNLSLMLMRRYQIERDLFISSIQLPKVELPPLPKIPSPRKLIQELQKMVPPLEGERSELVEVKELQASQKEICGTEGNGNQKNHQVPENGGRSINTTFIEMCSKLKVPSIVIQNNDE